MLLVTTSGFHQNHQVYYCKSLILRHAHVEKSDNIVYLTLQSLSSFVYLHILHILIPSIDYFNPYS